LDYKRADDDGYKRVSNIIRTANLDERMVFKIIITMLMMATLLGICLVCLTNIIVLLIGMVYFVLGIFYTFGSTPLSRLPLGEIFQG